MTVETPPAVEWMDVEVPNYVVKRVNAAAAFIADRKLKPAEHLLLEALRRQPGNVQARKNLGVCLKLQGRFREAEGHARRAVELNIFDPEAMMNLGGCLEKLGRLDEALDCFKATTILEPTFYDAHYNMGLMRMLKGDFTEGWNLYGHRWSSKNKLSADVSAKCWRGEDWRDFDGKDVVLFAEQGIGDCIQFLRFVKGFRQLCSPKSLRISLPNQVGPLAMMVDGVDAVTVEGRWGEYGICYPLFEMVKHLDFCNGSYLRMPLTGQKTRKVGLCWKGNKDHPNDKWRSIHREDLLDVLNTVPGVEWVSLQWDGSLRWAATYAGKTVVGLAENLSELRMLVSVDSGPAHIAGAMGLPTWLMVPFSPDWRWEVGKDTTRWYPNHKLFRQQEPEEGWKPTLKRVAEALRKESDQWV